MNYLLERIAEFESRLCLLSESELHLRSKHMHNLVTSNAFEGLELSNIDKKLYDLALTKKLSTTEYLTLCRQVAAEMKK